MSPEPKCGRKQFARTLSSASGCKYGRYKECKEGRKVKVRGSKQHPAGDHKGSSKCPCAAKLGTRYARGTNAGET